jgi:hypothetical protein
MAAAQMKNTILYLTDNSVPAEIGDLCKRILLREAGDIPIVSVSQKPIDFGINVCVGEIGRSWMSLYTQILAGLAVIKTDNVVIAEHDCLYLHEHLSYQPINQGAFYYNFNHWLVEWHGHHPEIDGMYSYWPKRTALSQLVCTVDLLRQSTEEVMRLLNMGLKVDKGLHWYGEPGQTSEQFRQAFVEASSGRPTQLQAYLKDYITKYQTEHFMTKQPNLDIRHGSNFTGPKRGNKRCYELEPWGKFAEVMKWQ